MVEPVQMDADPPEAISLAQAIANLESVRDVVDNPSDLKQFGLAEPPIIVEFKAAGGASGSFKLGNKNPTQSEMYAMKGGETRSCWCRRSRNRTSTTSRSSCATRRF